MRQGYPLLQAPVELDAGGALAVSSVDGYTRSVEPQKRPEIARTQLDQDALSVVEHLQREGHVTYFVGGCVRDALLGRTPKDFDIATDATPEQLKTIFGRRCRIIGRRFRLAHIHSGSLVLEVATFRGAPDDQEVADDASGFVVRANTFGSPEQDARSRDFTINGLFYDPGTGQVIDWVNGKDDIAARKLKTIGEAHARLREDPVRLLRAIKFAARLGFDIDAPITDESADVAPLLIDCPAARVSEELFRLIESGHARKSFELMESHGVIAALLPELIEAFELEPELRDELCIWLDELDRLTRAHGTLPRTASYALVAWPIVRRRLRALDPRAEWGKLSRSWLRDVAVRLSIPIRQRQTLQLVAELMRRLDSPNRRPTAGNLRNRALPIALSIVRLEFLLGSDNGDRYEQWAEAAERVGVFAAPFDTRSDERPKGAKQQGDSPPKRRRRRRRQGGEKSGKS